MKIKLKMLGCFEIPVAHCAESEMHFRYFIHYCVCIRNPQSEGLQLKLPSQKIIAHLGPFFFQVLTLKKTAECNLQKSPQPQQ